MNESNITIRPVRPSDASDCGRIIHQAFQTFQEHHRMPVDFPNAEIATHVAASMASHPQFFGVVAERGGEVIGSNFLDVRDVIAGVGPITVDPGAQASGAGRKLMQAVIERGRGMRGIRLVQEAYNCASLSLYTSLGFDVKEPLALLAGRITAPAPIDGEVRPMREADLPACAKLCSRVHGFDRTGELRDAIARLKPVVLERDGAVVAYASAPDFWIVNHGVAASEQDMIDLLAGAGQIAPGGAIGLLVPMRESNFFRWCLRSGLRIQKPMTLMSMGEYHEPREGCWFPSVVY
jgi:predicted N-acetyltransferase YhbS